MVVDLGVDHFSITTSLPWASLDSFFWRPNVNPVGVCVCVCVCVCVLCECV